MLVVVPMGMPMVSMFIAEAAVTMVVPEYSHKNQIHHDAQRGDDEHDLAIHYLLHPAERARLVWWLTRDDQLLS